MVKSDGFLSPPPLLMTCFITTNVPSCGLLSEVSFDESDDEESDDEESDDEEEAEDEDVFTSTSLDFLSSSPSDTRDVDKDDKNDIFLLLLSWDSAYEFKSTKVDKDNTVATIKRMKLKANPGVSFGNNILLLLLDYIP
jgi:hypothetical protein